MVSIFLIHSEELACKERSLISACACTYLNYDTLIIIFILRKKKYLKVMLTGFHMFLGLCQLFPGHFLHFLIRLFINDLEAVLHILPCLLQFIVFFHNGSDVTLLLHRKPEYNT